MTDISAIGPKEFHISENVTADNLKQVKIWHSEAKLKAA